jgi:hypothetical protein
MDATRPRAKRGPKPKDPTRVQTTVTLPHEVRARAQALADRDGLSLTNTIERLLAEALDVPVPAYCLPKSTDQEELPLSKAS